MEESMVVTDREALGRLLLEAQGRRDERLAFMIGRPLAASLSDGRLRDWLDMLLPMAQGRSIHLCRERSGDWRVVLHLRYRMGVRVADAYRRGDLCSLIPEEREALDRTLAIVATAREGASDPLVLGQSLFDAVRSCAVYENPALGSAAHRGVVSAASVLVGGRGNCQGFADAYYLLGSLAGLAVRYQAGFKGRAAHLWNLLLVDGDWQTVDVTSGAFLPEGAELAALGLSMGCL